MKKSKGDKSGVFSESDSEIYTVDVSALKRLFFSTPLYYIRHIWTDCDAKCVCLTNCKFVFLTNCDANLCMSDKV